MSSMMNMVSIRTHSDDKSLQEDTRRDKEAFNYFSKEQRNIIHANNPGRVHHLM